MTTWTVPEINADIPRKVGTCEYCLRETVIYAYVLWVCRRCLEGAPNA